MTYTLIGRAVRALWVAALALALTGCVVETETYLSEPGSEPPDLRLVGAWQLAGGKDGGLGVLLIRTGDDGALDMLSLEASDDEATGAQTHKWSTSRAWTTTIDNEAYANLDLDGNRMVVAYRMLENGDIVVGLMHPDLFRDAIEAGRLDGTVVGDTVTVTADAPGLTAFLRAHGGHALFDFGDTDGQIMLEPYRFKMP